MSNDADTAREEFEAQRAQEAQAQNLPEGAVPETRPQATINPDPVKGKVAAELEERGEGHAAPAATLDDYERAASPEQARKAAKQELPPERLFPGAVCVIADEDDVRYGVNVAINGVSEWASPEDEVKASLGTPDSRFAQVKSYSVTTRDDRAEAITVEASKLRRVDRQAFARTTG